MPTLSVPIRSSMKLLLMTDLLSLSKIKILMVAVISLTYIKAVRILRGVVFAYHLVTTVGYS